MFELGIITKKTFPTASGFNNRFHSSKKVFRFLFQESKCFSISGSRVRHETLQIGVSNRKRKANVLDVLSRLLRSSGCMFINNLCRGGWVHLWAVDIIGRRKEKTTLGWFPVCRQEANELNVHRSFLPADCKQTETTAQKDKNIWRGISQHLKSFLFPCTKPKRCFISVLRQLVKAV